MNIEQIAVGIKDSHGLDMPERKLDAAGEARKAALLKRLGS